MVAAAAIGQTIGLMQGLPSADFLLPLLFGGAAYYLTSHFGMPGPRGRDNVRYWRGRRIDEE